MPFCPSCGSQTSGNFCTSCGRPIAGEPAAAPATGPAPVTAAAPAKKSNLLVWILVGLAGLFLLVGILVVGGGLFLAHKVASNPAQFIAKALESTNPNVEVLKVDEGSGILEVRDKTTGKVMRLNFEDAKRGKFVFEEDGKTVGIETNKDDGGVHIRTSDGSSVDIGSSAKIPSWVPVYPGAQVQGALAGNSSDGEGGTATFLSNDPVETVVSKYEGQLKGAGYTIESTTKMGEGQILTAKNGNRGVNVIVGKAGSQTSISVTYGAK